MRRLILAVSILTMGSACILAPAQEYVQSRPGDGIPDFYYFPFDYPMPPGAIYAGEIFPAGTFVIDPDGQSFGLATIVVEGPPALDFDTNPDPGKRTAPDHTSPGSIVTANLTDWNSDSENYSDNSLWMALIRAGAMDQLHGASRTWAVGYMPGDTPTMQLGMTAGAGLGTKTVNGQMFEMKDILTKGLIYEGGLFHQFGYITFGNTSGQEMKTHIANAPLQWHVYSETVIDSSMTIDHQVEDNLKIIQGANPPTVVDVVSPAGLPSHLMADIDIYDSSVLNFAGRGEWTIRAHDSTTVSMSAGQAIGLDAYESSTLDVSGGSIFDLVTHNHSSLSVSGGRIAYMTSLSSSTVDMSGGEVVASIRASGSSTLTISGGTCCNEYMGAGGWGTLNVLGGIIDPSMVWAEHSGTINIFGTDFNYDYGTIPDENGRIVGLLKDGSPIDIPFEIQGRGSINLVVPEPPTLLMLAIVGITFGGIAWRRRRQ